jgi:hypothetical protein
MQLYNIQFSYCVKATVQLPIFFKNISQKRKMNFTKTFAKNKSEIFRSNPKFYQHSVTTDREQFTSFSSLQRGRNFLQLYLEKLF